MAKEKKEKKMRRNIETIDNPFAKTHVDVSLKIREEKIGGIPRKYMTKRAILNIAENIKKTKWYRENI